MCKHRPRHRHINQLRIIISQVFGLRVKWIRVTLIGIFEGFCRPIFIFEGFSGKKYWTNYTTKRKRQRD